MALIADRIRVKESQHLIKWLACEYGIFFLSDKMLAILLKTMVHSLAIPPVDAKTKGVNAPCSTSRTRWAYSLFSRFHACGIVRQGLSGNRRRQLGNKP